MPQAIKREDDALDPRITPTGAALGADVSGLDISRPLSPQAVRTLKQGWADHHVLRFRGQRLDDDQLMAFSACFGKLDTAPRGAANPKEKDQEGFVTVISNIVVDGKAIGGLGAYEALWHTDMSYNDVPPLGSMLYAIEVPPAGGDTGFVNMCRAYDTLPADVAARVATLACKHDASLNSAGELRRGYTEVVDPREAPGAAHPLVIRHPVSGRKALYLGRRKNAYVIGLPLEESERLLDQLWAHATRAELAWYQQWRVGDLVMWDNFAVMHRRDAFDTGTRRLMHRTQITGPAFSS
jgi:taurine dioxygenase